MAKKKLYRTVIQIEVLSEDPIPEGMSLDQIEEECNTGSFSGVHDFIKTNEVIEGEEAVKAVMAQGSSPDFFQMDENGDEIEF